MPNTATQEIAVEFVNTKTKYPKFSSGSLKLTNGEWLTVSKDVDIDFFEKGENYSVDIETNDKGYQTIVQVKPKVKSETKTEIPTAKVQGRDAYAKPRDFDKENRGKTKCVMFEAALQSPAIAGMTFSTMEEYLKLVKQAADAGYDYTWNND